MTTETPNLSIKQWAEEDRPREKLLHKGATALSDAELIAILLGSGSRNESAVDLARRVLLTADNNLNNLGKKNIADLMKLKGIGEAKAITIVAAMELGRRRKAAEINTRKHITGSQDIYEMMLPLLGDLPHEEFWLLLLNRANVVIRKEQISIGGLSSTVVDVKKILKLTIENLATSIIICHNHPSGNLQPSHADHNITQQIKEAAQLIDTNLLDHIIVTDNGYYSFADEDRL